MFSLTDPFLPQTTSALCLLIQDLIFFSAMLITSACPIVNELLSMLGSRMKLGIRRVAGRWEAAAAISHADELVSAPRPQTEYLRNELTTSTRPNLLLSSFHTQGSSPNTLVQEYPSFRKRFLWRSSPGYKIYVRRKNPSRFFVALPHLMIRARLALVKPALVVGTAFQF